METALATAAIRSVREVVDASEVRSVLDAVVAKVEARQHAETVYALTRALKLARAHIEGVQAERERERVRRYKEAVEAAALRRDFEREIASVAALLDAKAAAEAKLADSQRTITRLKDALADTRKTGSSAGLGGAGGPAKSSDDGEYLFGRLRKDLLFKIVGFLAMNDVMALALSCQGLHRRIDNMFGDSADSMAVSRRMSIAAGVGVDANPAGQAPPAPAASPAPPLPAPTKPSPARSRFAGLLGRGSSSTPSPAKGAASSKEAAAMAARLAQMETDLATVIAQKEDLKAQLGANENVRNFLMVKVKEAEENVKKAEEQRDQALAQSTSDRQVISFLDAHTRELEEKTSKQAKELEQLREEKARERPLQEGKLKMLEEVAEMAKQEKAEVERAMEAVKQEHAEAEKEWKKERRQFVKALKSLKGQVAALTAGDD